jgi:ketosteroid isomerase-like protein
MRRTINPPRPLFAIVFLLAVSLGLAMTGMAADDDEDEPATVDERAAVEQTINNCLGWAVEKDFDLFYNTIADDSAFVSVTPYAKVKFGVAEVKAGAGFWASPDFKAISHEIRDLHITFAKSGEVAWFFCRVDDINEWKGEPANWIDVRWTGVVEKREGRWRIVQQHFSWPREN